MSMKVYIFPPLLLLLQTSFDQFILRFLQRNLFLGHLIYRSITITSIRYFFNFYFFSSLSPLFLSTNHWFCFTFSLGEKLIRFCHQFGSLTRNHLAKLAPITISMMPRPDYDYIDDNR